MSKLNIDFAKMDNLVVENKTCGCVVTFFKETKWRSSRLVPCTEHKPVEQYRERGLVVAEARTKRDTFFETLASDTVFEM